MQIGGFGFGLPHGVFAAMGFRVRDVTLAPAPHCAALAGFIEPFMDPFAASLLHRLGAGQLNHLGALIFLRESPGAVHAFHYACEFERRGLLPQNAPALILFNLIPAATPAAQTFNRSEIARLGAELSGAGCTASAPLPNHVGAGLFELEKTQAEGEIPAAEAFDACARLAGGGAEEPDKSRPVDRSPHSCEPSQTAQQIPPHGQPLSPPPPGHSASQARSQHTPVSQTQGPRLALLGAPLGNGALHHLLDGIGLLLVDQQALDQARAAAGDDLDAALSAVAANPFSARQPEDIYVAAMAETLTDRRIDKVIWQVDPHDDLWGWLAPDIRAATEQAGADFVDLGAFDRWPDAPTLAAITTRLTPEATQ